MIGRENPLGVQAVADAFDEEHILEQLKEQAEKISAAESARQPWVDKQILFLKQREGVRPPKNIPWPGCHNDNWPITDPLIRRWTPGMANLILMPEPVARFLATNPADVEKALSAQEFYHWLFTNHIEGTAHEGLELIDNIGQMGIGYTRQGWDYRTELVSRIARVEALFPGGIEPNFRQFLAEMQQMVQQQGGQLTEDQIPTIEQFVAQKLVSEYRIDPQRDIDSLTRAVEGILNGATSVRLIYRSLISDKPAWESISPIDVIRPSKSTAIERDGFLVLVHHMDKDEIEDMVADGYFARSAADDILDQLDSPLRGSSDSLIGSRRESLRQLYDRVDGVKTAEMEDLPQADIWEIYSRTDLGGGGPRERAVHWWHNPSKTHLATFRYPYPFREWPVTEFRFERRSKRPLSSRGIAQMVTVHQKTATSIHNARLDAAQIVLAPTFKERAIGGHLKRNWTFRPGGRIPVTDISDVEPIVHDTRPLIELLREETMTKTLAEQQVGIFDPSLAQLQGTGRERRTATEVDAVVSQATEVHSLDAAIFQLSMAKVHQQIWDLWEDFGPEEVFYNVLGEEQPKLARKSEISGDYHIIPAGSPLSTNRALMLSRARELLTFAMQDDSFTINKYEAWREFLAAHGWTYMKRMLRSPEEAQILQQAVAELQRVNEEAGP